MFQLCDFVTKERSTNVVYPTPDNVFTWTRACKLSEVKVVILGQDPYHGPNQAHGKTEIIYRYSLRFRNVCKYY